MSKESAQQAGSDKVFIQNMRHRAASVALAATVFLALLKIGVSILSGSVGVLSEGVHSLLDFVSAAVAFFTVREAGKPADREHPFGHGKLETLSSLLEALLLVAAAVWIVYEGVLHWIHPVPLQYQGLAIATMALSLVLSFWIYRHNWNAALITDSSAIRLNALHFLSDVIASGGVLLALLLMQLTGWLLLDPLVAFFVAAYIFLISAKQVTRALFELTDRGLPEDEVKKIRGLLRGFKGKVIGVHDLRTRRSGTTRHIDFHLVVCGVLSVRHSHQVCDEMETRIMESFPDASVNIHVEPCEHENVNCHLFCDRPERLKK